jgi:17beta-estradiol 17-dehydrogenase / very-long-chain 3-oxoacyl-CoA reductase
LDLSASVAPVVQGKRVVALVNNVGYTSTYQAFAIQDTADVDRVLNILAFTTYITQILLPSMYDGRPALVINVAGLTRQYPAPLLAVHSGEKSYVSGWSRALSLEFELAHEPKGADVEVLCVDVHVVSSNSNSSPKSFFAPDGTQMGKAIVGAVGCGKRVVTAYWPHELSAGILKWIPVKLMDGIMTKQLVAMKDRELKVIEERAKAKTED